MPQALLFYLTFLFLKAFVKISNLKLGTKLYLGFGLLVLFLMILSVASLIQTKGISELMKVQNALRTQKLEQLSPPKLWV